eukprot:scaffold37962_cov16-Tisochrysis_lutea.AAC.1
MLALSANKVTHMQNALMMFAAQVACGMRHMLALSAGGEVYAWGSNAQHQLGLQDTKMRTTPTLLPHLPLCTAVAACMVSLAISFTGRLYIFGYDHFLNPAPYEEPCAGEAGLPWEGDASDSGSGNASTFSNPSVGGLEAEASAADVVAEVSLAALGVGEEGSEEEQQGPGQEQSQVGERQPQQLQQPS